ncbi:MAG: Holliday junction resolvase RuvX [Limisphaerales bacterium]|jgi:putative Holliday junction resolvase
MRVLALDHGTVRIGLALSDPTGSIAQPMGFWPAVPLDDFVVKLQALMREKEVEQIIVGMPRNMDGSYGAAAQKVEEFVAVLRKAVEVGIELWDERLTSVQANRLLIDGGVRRDKRRQKVDALAAAVLLQSYLDSKSWTSSGLS